MNARQIKELKSLEVNGVLYPERIVKFAKNPKTALHKAFDWNLKRAAMQHWLHQARQLIVKATITIQGSREPIRLYVSLKSDRVNPGGGYRQTIAVLSDEEQRTELLQQAFDDLERFRRKYESLAELAPLFAAAKGIKSKKGKKSA
jgi:hypothetical protein